MFVAFYICTFLMSFVYMPIPGYSVHAERQLCAGLGPWLGLLMGMWLLGLENGQGDAHGPDYSNPAF